MPITDAIHKADRLEEIKVLCEVLAPEALRREIGAEMKAAGAVYGG